MIFVIDPVNNIMVSWAIYHKETHEWRLWISGNRRYVMTFFNKRETMVYLRRVYPSKLLASRIS